MVPAALIIILMLLLAFTWPPRFETYTSSFPGSVYLRMFRKAIPNRYRKFANFTRSFTEHIRVHGKPSDNDSGYMDMSFQKAFKGLFDLILHPLSNPTFVDQDGNTWIYPNDTDWNPIWTAGLGKELCIFDMDNRVYNDNGQTWDPNHFNWDGVGEVPSGPFNHYMYCK
jgi:hypothetical protein